MELDLLLRAVVKAQTRSTIRLCQEKAAEYVYATATGPRKDAAAQVYEQGLAFLKNWAETDPVEFGMRSDDIVGAFSYLNRYYCKHHSKPTLASEAVRLLDTPPPSLFF